MAKPTLDQFYRAAGKPLPPREWIEAVERALAMAALSDEPGSVHLFDPFVLSMGHAGAFVYPTELTGGPHTPAPRNNRIHELWRIADELSQLVVVLSSRYGDRASAWFTKGTRCVVPRQLLPGDYLSRRDPTQIDCTVHVVDSLQSRDQSVVFETSDGTRFMPPAELLTAALRKGAIVLLSG